MPHPQPLCDRLASHLQQRREALAWTQETLAERAGISPRTVQRMEQTRYNPRLGMIERLARAVGVDPYHLLTPTSPPIRRGPGQPRKAGRRG